MDGKKQCFVYTHTCIHHCWKEHQISRKCILLWHLLLFVSMSSDFSCKWRWRSNTPCLCHLLWLLNSRFIFWLATKAPLHAWSLKSCTPLCLCVGGEELKIWRTERECKQLFPLLSMFPFFLLVLLHLSPLFFTRPVCTSVSQSVSPPAFLLSIPPHIYVHFPVLWWS